MPNKDAESSLRELQTLLPEDVRQGYTSTYEEEINLALRHAGSCNFDELATNLMNVGWWSQELTGKINILERKKRITPQERLKIGNAIVRLESSLVDELQGTLAQKCSCSFK